MVMDPKLKAAWVDDLENGGHNQCRSFLHLESREGDHSFCCLGRLCEVAGVPAEKSDGVYMYADHCSVLPTNVMEQTGLTHYYANLLAGKNDRSATFREIADYIKNNADI